MLKAKPTDVKQNIKSAQPSIDDNKITRDEFRQIVKSMDRKEFENYMGDYIKEISNPDNVIEQNQFLKNAEVNKDLPQNVKLAQPKKGFCIKTEKFSIKRPGIRQKVYINICQLEEIKPPEEDQKERGMWSLPHLVNKGRNDQDTKGNLCTTYDVVFNQKAIQMSNMYPSFKKFVCDTSISAINNNFLKSEQEKLSNDFVVKSKFDYKGKEVALMNVHSLYRSELDSRKEPKENYKTSIQKEIEEKKNKNSSEENPIEEEDEKVFDKPDIDVEISEKEVKEMEEKKKLENSQNHQNLIPKHVIKYSSEFELHKHFYLPSSVDERNSEKLVIEIEVPKMENLNFADLEIDTKKLHFKYRDVYLLDLDLPSEIDKEKSSAKFDRKKNLLTISASLVQKKKELAALTKEDDKFEIGRENEFKPENEGISKQDAKKEPSNYINDIIKIASDNEISNEKNISNLTEKDNSEYNSIKALECEQPNERFRRGETEKNFKDLSQIPNEKLEVKSDINDPLKEKNSINDSNFHEQESKPKIQEIPKDQDDDDISNAISQSTNDINKLQNNLIKISYINFNCEMIYEID